MPEVSKKMVRQGHSAELSRSPRHPEPSRRIVGEVKIPTEVLAEIQKKINNVLEFKKKIETSLESEVTEILNIILGGAINLEASDIHIEPEEEKVKIRVRLDGILQDVTNFNRGAYNTLLSRIKLLSGIKLNIADRPQDGRFSIVLPPTNTAGGGSIEIRASTLPAEYGEAIVLRVLNPKSLISLEDLGLRKDLLELFKNEIKKPNGMIIVTGPTGSGKTTTLYSFLKEIQKPEIKIITIEDPIEYHLGGISQTQVNPAKGYDFATGLKSIMRQDPDVILVGEIRDLKTSDIALQAALTGHLVFTTLHTNDAAGTIARLINLGAKPQDIGPAINLTIAQRLVRKVCSRCAKLEKPSAQVLKKIRKELRGLLVKFSQEIKILQAVGCRDCNFTGYQGRIGIFEAFLIDDEMEKFILKSPSIAALREEAIKKGMKTMRQDGVLKVLERMTTLEEVERVTAE